MPIIVNNGTTLTIDNITGLTIVTSSTIAPSGVLDGAGTVSGNFLLANQGTISADVTSGTIGINTGTLTNTGTLLASKGTLAIQSSVTATNLSGSTLTGGVWMASGTGELDILTGLIVTDNATITLDGAASVIKSFNSGGGTLQSIENSLTTVGSSGRLNLLNGRDFQVSDSLVVNGTVTLGGGTLSAPTNGITIGVGGKVIGSGALDSGTPVTVNGIIEAQGGTLSIPQAQNMSGSGTLQADAGASLVLQAFGSYAESIVNNGTIDVAFVGATGILGIAGPYSGTGGFLIQGGFDSADRAILKLPGSVAANVAFDTNFGELRLDSPSSYTGTITAFGNNNTLVLTGVANASHATLSGNVLSLTNNGGTLVQAITLAASSMNYSSAIFSVVENGGNSQATVGVSGAAAAACYVAGTKIRTVSGDVPVEQLAAGDIAWAHFAGNAPVVWIGHRHVDCRRHPDPPKVWPVRVAAHAFGPRLPHRDLFLSPDHAVFADGVLIPIKHLINGKTIVQVKIDTVTYYHVELAEHDVLTAEGLLAESYLENGDRCAFDNGGPAVLLHPDFGIRRWEAFGCAPLVVTGTILNGVKKRIDERAADPKSIGQLPRRAA